MLKTLIALLALVALAFVLNPGPDAHREKLKTEIAARNKISALLHLGNLAALATDYHTVGVASYATLNGQTVSFGALGFVFVPDLK